MSGAYEVEGVVDVNRVLASHAYVLTADKSMCLTIACFVRFSVC